ncbi:MAG: Yip1 family protein [Hydrogenophaga sp.]|uniref:Yip1 family protein n=1 Tax=Hydrogenophaga sp. TaxID=1904254 RepID=UPI00262E9619|nr:Yip1 family protein [Hydrogenophaga sp.]MDD3785759.1 Yip1 family protein [Hydrogenophaga sp.]
MNIIQRVQDILFKPKETWPAIATETDDIPSIYKNYLIYLAAIPAVATFIGMSLIGFGGFGMHFRVPIVSGLVNMVVGFVLSLAMIYVLALIANELAPRFQGEKNLPNAFKLVAYGATAGLVGGIFNLLPSLSMLGLLAALYSIYLLYTGVPVMMKTPQDKSLVYTAVLIVCGIVAGLIVGAVSAIFTGGSKASMMGKAPADMTIKVPGTEIKVDTAKLEEAGKKMEEAAKRMEEAQARGDGAAAGKALGEMMGALGGGAAAKAMDTSALRAFVPEQLGGLARTSFEVSSNQTMGLSMASVEASYERDNQQLDVKVIDVGAVPALAMGMMAWTATSMERETQDSVERIYQRDGLSFKEAYGKNGSHAELMVALPNGVLVEFDGRGLGIDEVKTALGRFDLKGLAGLQRPQ